MDTKESLCTVRGYLSSLLSRMAESDPTRNMKQTVDLLHDILEVEEVKVQVHGKPLHGGTLLKNALSTPFKVTLLLTVGGSGDSVSSDDEEESTRQVNLNRNSLHSRPLGAQCTAIRRRLAIPVLIASLRNLIGWSGKETSFGLAMLPKRCCRTWASMNNRPVSS